MEKEKETMGSPSIVVVFFVFLDKIGLVWLVAQYESVHHYKMRLFWLWYCNFIAGGEFTIFQ